MFNRDPQATPSWATKMSKRWANGVCQGTNGAVWLYRSVPLGPVDDAVDTPSMLAVAEPVVASFRELAKLARVRLDRRRMVKSSYREVHLLLLNTPKRYVPDDEQPLRSFLSQQHPNADTDNRVLLLGVKAKDDLGASGGLKGRIDSFVSTFSEGGVPMEDYQADIEMVDRALRRAGLTVPSEADFNLADAWWNIGRHAETPVLPHDDHLHVFASHAAMSTAWSLEEDSIPCMDWPTPMRGHHTLSLLAYRNLEFQERAADTSGARWASEVRMRGAAAISIRGLIEPPNVTRGELRRGRNRFRSDIREQQQADKMERAELLDTASELRYREAEFSDEGAQPVLIDTSVVVALNGADESGRYDAAGLANTAAWSNMLGIQDRALEETMLCSNVRANPTLKDLPVSAIAYSGLPSLSVVGDAEGALLGFTERDHQPAYISHRAAYAGDSYPLMLVAGSTGSGKACDVSTLVPVPLTSANATGKTTMGALKVGDKVFGRDGKPCTVTWVSDIRTREDMYRVTLSDGQTIDADFDHQWVVSDFNGRNGTREPKHLTAIDNHRAAHVLADRLDARAAEFTGDHDSTLKELFAIVSGVEDAHWNTESSMYAAMKMVDVPTHTATRVRPVPRHHKVARKTDPVQLFNVRDLLSANLDVWQNTSGGNAVQWRDELDTRIAAAKHLIATCPQDQEESASTISKMMTACGAVQPHQSLLGKVARKAGVQSHRGYREVVLPMPDAHTADWEATVYPTAVALRGLATRVRQQYANTPTMDPTERRMTTGEILGEGVRMRQGHARFAIRVSEPMDGHDLDLPVEPYVFGAWLGDGSSNSGQIAQGHTSQVCVDPLTGISDREHMMANLAAYDPRPLPSNDVVIGTRGLSADLRRAGVLNDKHIPALYARASAQQRLAVLQGLMDTEGTIDVNGSCELSLSDERLAIDALELVRGLGIKASMTFGPCSYVDEGGERVDCKDRYRIHFTTAQHVFRLPRKARRLPETVRETQRWLYITSIEEIDPVQARCIQVDSPDRTYLIGNSVPTSNTMALLYLAYQWSQLDPPIPQVIIDPKALTLDTPLPTPTGWTTMGQVQVGEQVIGRDGQPCNVVHKSQVFTADEVSLFDFTFDDGQVIRGDDEHQWVVVTPEGRAALEAGRSTSPDVLRGYAQTVAELSRRREPVEWGTADQILDLIRSAGVGRWSEAEELERVLVRAEIAQYPSGEGEQRWSIRQVLPVLMQALHEEADLGSEHYQVITTAELRQRLSELDQPLGYFAVPLPAPLDLPDADLPQDPYELGQSLGSEAEAVIPVVYLRASIQQRTNLLRGLMDARGRIEEDALCIDVQTRSLAADITELLRSLGMKVFTQEREGVHTLTFSTDVTVFSDQERRDAAPGARAGSDYHFITSVRRIESQDAQCIRVDSIDHTYLAGQFVVTHNTGSDHSDAVEAAGGRVRSLDDLSAADGIFDPLRFAGNSQAGIEVATSMLLNIDPWPEGKKQYESELQIALKYGVERGATCIGQALRIAEADDMASEKLLGPIFKLLESSSFFRACVGVDPEGDGLRVANGITLIKVGNTHLDLPQPGKDPETMNQRIAVGLVRMMVFGSAMAMTGRQGVLHFDEAWVAMAGGATEVERLGRLARSQTVLPILYTQRVSDAVNNGLAGYISRGLIMHIGDPEEAEAACALFKLDPDLRVPRITAPAVVGGSTTDIAGKINYGSLKALTEGTGKSRRVVRGAVAIYRDLAGRAVPVTVTIPKTFLDMASTNPDDIARKKKVTADFEAARAKEEAAIALEESGAAELERASVHATEAELGLDESQDLPEDPVAVGAGQVDDSDVGDLFD